LSYSINKSIKAKHYGKQRDVNKIKYIAIHYTANTGTTATAKSNAKYFAETTREASAHYVVDKNSVIYQCVPDNYVAYAVGGSVVSAGKAKGGATLKGICTNSNSISIEMVSCSNANGYYIPEETINRTIELIKDLQKKYPNAKNVCRHFDCTGKACPRTHCMDEKGEANWKAFLNKLNNKNNTIEYNSTNDIVWELANRKLLSDKEYWLNAMKEGTNLFYFGKRVCELTVNTQGKQPLDNRNDILWELSDGMGILTAKDYWLNEFNNNYSTYCFARNVANMTKKK